jgi:hypothetical protein
VSVQGLGGMYSEGSELSVRHARLDLVDVGRDRVEYWALTGRLVIDEHDGDVLGHNLIY